MMIWWLVDPVVMMMVVVMVMVMMMMTYIYTHEHDDIYIYIYRYRYMAKISKIRVLEAIGALVAAEELVREAHVAAHATDSTLCVHHFSEGSIF
jgi:hypothetical protein